jgi:3-phenylpropionate/cinnamic acid dioxygenase small subunit
MDADELEIRNLLAALAQLADHGELEEYLALFDPDAVWVVPAVPQTGVAAAELRGVDAIADGVRQRRAAGVQGPGTDTAHVVTTTVVRFEGDDRAVARSTWLYLADTSTAPRLASVGRYTDTFTRTPAGWRLARREIALG